MKKIIFPATSRVHLARQQLLLKELRKHFIVDIWEPKEQKSGMAISAIFYAIEFNNYLIGKEFDFALIRGDRYEMLPIATTCVYRGIPIVHIEGGDLSGAVDNKVRHAITQLSDYHFCTNEDSHKRLISMGVSPHRVWNFGSLDVEFASKVKSEKIKKEPYILVTYHPLEDENEGKLDLALLDFKKYVIIKVGSNSDYGRKYGEETYSPEDYINLLHYASVCVGNSSSLLKEASILGTPVVLVGNRQHNRLRPRNVVNVGCETYDIKTAISYQLKNKRKKDLTYYKPHTSKLICKTLRKVL